MQLYLLRHGIAADLGDHGVARDADRPLTEAGRLGIRQEALGMHRLGLRLDLILTSPLLRAHQTARAVAEVFDLEDKLIELPALGLGHCFRGGIGEDAPIFSELRAYKFDRALLVGHEPDLSGLASVLLTGGRSLGINFKKGSLCAIQLHRLALFPPGDLLWLMAPKQLRQLGK